MSYAQPGGPYDRQPPPITKQDEDNIRLLSILFYVYSGIVGFTALIFGGFSILGIVAAGSATGGRHAPADAWIIGGVLLVVFGFVSVLFIAKAVVMILAGRALARRSSYVMAMVGACLALMNVPLGTALGIFTIVTLQKEAVKRLFATR